MYDTRPDEADRHERLMVIGAEEYLTGNRQTQLVDIAMEDGECMGLCWDLFERILKGQGTQDLLDAMKARAKELAFENVDVDEVAADLRESA